MSGVRSHSCREVAEVGRDDGTDWESRRLLGRTAEESSKVGKRVRPFRPTWLPLVTMRHFAALLFVSRRRGSLLLLSTLALGGPSPRRQRLV